MIISLLLCCKFVHKVLVQIAGLNVYSFYHFYRSTYTSIHTNQNEYRTETIMLLSFKIHKFTLFSVKYLMPKFLILFSVYIRTSTYIGHSNCDTRKLFFIASELKYFTSRHHNCTVLQVFKVASWSSREHCMHVYIIVGMLVLTTSFFFCFFHSCCPLPECLGQHSEVDGQHPNFQESLVSIHYRISKILFKIIEPNLILVPYELSITLSTRPTLWWPQQKMNENGALLS